MNLPTTEREFWEEVNRHSNEYCLARDNEWASAELRKLNQGESPQTKETE